MKNEVVNGGVTIILFVVTNLVGLPKKRNLSIFLSRSQRGRDVAPVPSEMVRALAQEEGVDPYHSGSSPTRIE